MIMMMIRMSRMTLWDSLDSWQTTKIFLCDFLCNTFLEVLCNWLLSRSEIEWLTSWLTHRPLNTMPNLWIAINEIKLSLSGRDCKIFEDLNLPRSPLHVLTCEFVLGMKKILSQGTGNYFSQVKTEIKSSALYFVYIYAKEHGEDWVSMPSIGRE